MCDRTIVSPRKIQTKNNRMKKKRKIAEKNGNRPKTKNTHINVFSRRKIRTRTFVLTHWKVRY